ncbi:S53 family peptidase [Dyella sp. 20L07]|uniref:S53 family peptidase n=1 Tax=Dyella sp. 20L07 TaxID=3384240 RepID=UPI003D297633
MRNTLHRKTLATSLALLLGGLSTASLAANGAAPADLGASNASQTVTVTLVLKLHNQAALEDYVQHTVTSGDPLYHQFLTTDQFSARYGATASDIARVQAFLKQQGITPGAVAANHLAIQATGTIRQFNAAFQTSVHDYQSAKGQYFRRPSSQVVIPSVIADTLLLPSGLNTEAKLHPNIAKVKQGVVANAHASNAATALQGSGTASGVPGQYTVGDVANFYNINPLYKAGINGNGSTVAIVTLADFLPSDAYAYWSMIGLPVKPNRITQIHVDGGGPLAPGVGDDETSLDVEQSGGLAPWANIRVYDGPNTNQGFLDVFNQAVSDNIADSISVSWDEAEIDYYPQLTGGVDERNNLTAFHQIFLEAAVQGISMFCASGDSGAYETVEEYGDTNFNAPLTVNAPASDPYITSAGGTTRPYDMAFTLYNGSALVTGPVISNSRESAWGWDYLANYGNTYHLAAPSVGWRQWYFSTGTGGGVSVFWNKPFYQQIVSGIRRTEPGQSFIYYGGSAPQTIITLPSNFAGRNLPDISLNADPYTGYVLISTEDGGVLDGYGGTSFVAPQLNGISALLRQSTGHRIGLWNPQLYALQAIFGYGLYSPFNDIKTGDNWYYYGVPGYEPATGLGTINVTNLDQFLRAGF